MINGFMPAIGESIRSISSGPIERPPQHCPRGHLLRPGRMLVIRSRCSSLNGSKLTSDGSPTGMKLSIRAGTHWPHWRFGRVLPSFLDREPLPQG